MKWRMRSGLLFCAILCSFDATMDPQALRVAKGIRKPELVCVLCSLTVAATPSAVNFTLVQGGTATGSSSIVITTTLNGVSLLSTLSLYGYFTSASAALTDGNPTPNKIPSSAVLGQVPTGSPTTFTAFTQSGMLGTPGATLQLFSTVSLSSLGCVPASASCRTDNLSLAINLSSLPQLPAGTYTGTLILQAEAL
jgi:hypothetical protein